MARKKAINTDNPILDGISIPNCNFEIINTILLYIFRVCLLFWILSRSTINEMHMYSIKEKQTTNDAILWLEYHLVQNEVKEPIGLILENLLNVNIVKDIEIITKGGKILDVGSRGEYT